MFVETLTKGQKQFNCVLSLREEAGLLFLLINKSCMHVLIGLHWLCLIQPTRFDSHCETTDEVLEIK